MADQTASPPAAAATPVPRLAQFLADVATFRDQVVNVDPATFDTPQALAAWVRSQLVDNVVELMAAFADAVAQDVVAYVQDIGTVVQRMQEDEDEVLSVESAEILMGTLDAAEAVCRLAAKAVPKLDQIGAAKLQQAITAFRARAADARSLIDEITEPVDAETDGAEPPATATPPADDGAGGGEGG